MAVNKKVTIVALCSVLLVVMVIGIVITHVSNKNDANNASKGNVAQSMKAVKSMCKTTYYKDTCEKNLISNSNHTTEPKELIKVGFNVALKHINETIAKSTTLKDTATDPRTAGAYRVCEMMLDLAIDDLKRSFKKIDTFDFDVAKIEEHLFDLKVWLSGANTAQGTCLDAFQNTSGDAGEKMKKLLKTSRELTMNGFAMINELSRALTELHITNSAQNRKLLAEGMEVPSEGQYPSWVNEGERRLLKGKGAKKKPNVVVAQDGSGKYKTITEALKDIPIDNKVTFIIHIKAGVYKENFVVEKTMTNVMFVGDGPTKTIITGDRSVKKGFSTIESATVGVLGFHFMAKDIGFENTAAADEGPAVALHITSDQSIFHNCHINGYQDTLYSHDHRQFFRDCKISGTIDFIFGDSIAIFQNCEIVVRKPAAKQANAVIAQGREFEDDITAMVIQNCNFVAEPDLLADPKVKTYLGRPWKKYSKAIIMQSYIGEFISPDGWTIWEEANPNTDFSWIAEFENTGPGANVASRVKWPSYKTITKDVATAYTAAVFLRGDEWIVPSGVPYIGGFTTLKTGGMVFNNTNALFRNSANANASTNTMPSNSSANAMTPSSTTNTMPSNSSANVITPSTSDNVMTPSTSDNGMTSSTSVNAMTPSMISANAMSPSTSDNVIIPNTSANAMTPGISANVITRTGANDMTPSTSANTMPSNDVANSMAPSSITNTLTTTSSANAPTSNSNSGNAMSPSTSAYAMSPSTSANAMSPSTSVYAMSPSTGANVITPSTSANAMTPSISANVITPSTGANDMTPSTSANTMPSNDGANSMTPSSITNTLTTTSSANAPTSNSNSANAMSPSTSAYAMSPSTSANAMSPSTSDNAMTPTSSTNTMPSNEGSNSITPSSSTNTLTITSSANAPESNSNSANAMSPHSSSSSSANPTTSISAANTAEASTSDNGKTTSYSTDNKLPVSSNNGNSPTSDSTVYNTMANSYTGSSTSISDSSSTIVPNIILTF